MEREMQSGDSLAWFNTSPYFKNVKKLWIIMQFIYLLQEDLNVSKHILISKRDKTLKASGLWK